MKNSKKGEEFYRKVLYDSPIGYGYHEIILDDNGNPCDYRFLEVNSAFEKFTGLSNKNIIGKTVLEVLPKISEDSSNWISIYGNIALHKERMSFNSFSTALQRWYNVEAFSLEKGYFITIFTDITDLKEQELKLQELLEQRRLMFHDHGAIMLIIDPQTGKILEANSSAVDFYGYSEDELLSENIFDINILNKEYVEKYMDEANKHVRNFFCFQHRLKNGEIRNVDVNSSPIPYRNKNALFSVIVDVTDRELAKEELLRSQLLLTASLNSPKDIIILSLDKDYKYLIFNETHRNVMKYAYNANIEVGNCIFDYISDEEDIEKAKRNYSKALEGQAHVTRETYGDINIKTYETYYNPIKDDDGNIIGVSAYARDISEIIEAYRKLENEKMTAQKYLDIAGVMMLLLDIKGNVQLINEKGCSIINLEKDEIIGKNWFDEFIPNDYKKQIKNVFEKVVNTPNEFDTLDYENPIIDSKGNKRYIYWHNTKLYDIDGNAIGVLCSGEDVTERNNTLEKLKQNEKNLLNSQAIAHLGTWRLDVETNEVVWTEELYKMYGFDPKLPVPNYSEHMKLFKPESWERLSAALELTRTQGIPYELELETVTKDGSNGWMWVRGEAEKDRDGNIIAIWGAAQDITERKRILEQLKQKELNLLEAQKIAKMGSWRLDAKTNHVEWTGELYKMYGFDPTFPVPDLMEQKKLFTPESWERLSNSIDLSISKGIPYELEVQMLKNDGTMGWMWTRSEIEKNINGEIIAIHGVAQDITERKEQEEKLKLSEERLKTSEKILSMIMANVEEAIYGVDINDNCTFINQSFINLLGYSEQEVIGKNMHDLIHHSYPNGKKYPAGKCPMARAFKSGEKVKVDLDYLWNKKGQKIPVEFSSNPLFENGKLIGAVVGFKDISERLKYSEEIKLISQKQKLLLESATDIVFTVDKSMKYIDAYGTGLSLIKLNEIDYLNKKFMEVFGKEFWKDRKEKYELAFKGIKSEHIWNYKTKEKTIVYQTSISPLYDTNNEIVGAVGVSRDITDLHNKYQDLEYIGYHDFLTGLNNRRYFTEQLKKIDESKEYPFAILNVDINGLKTFNDIYGHETGDLVIKSVAETFKKNCSSDSITARIGGDEFAAILPNAKKEEIIKKRDAILEKISEISIMNIELSVSVGYYIKRNDSVSLHEAEKLAEDDMLKHKVFERNSNRNRAIQAIFKTLTDKYEEEKIHSQYVSQLSTSIGKALGMDKDQLQFLATAATFHDIGKISIPDSVLKKPGKLTAEEYETIKTHTEIGYQILSTADQYSDLAKHALYHHERWDGKGYPKGLAKEEIPLISRIICVADAYEAMTSDRVYRKKMTNKEVVKEIVRCSGTQFDPKIAREFVEKVLKKHWEDYL